MWSIPPATRALLLLNIGLWCADLYLGHPLARHLVLRPLGSGFEPWQLMTHSFVHVTWLHLAVNMAVLWQIGPETEQLCGARRFAGIYLAGVLGAALVHLLTSGATGAHTSAAGASGGLSAVVLAWGLSFPDDIISPRWMPRPVTVRAGLAAAIGLTVLFGLTGLWSNVAHFAHLGGMVGGYLALRAWPPPPPPRADTPPRPPVETGE